MRGAKLVPVIFAEASFLVHVPRLAEALRRSGETKLRVTGQGALRQCRCLLVS